MSQASSQWTEWQLPQLWKLHCSQLHAPWAWGGHLFALQSRVELSPTPEGAGSPCGYNKLGQGAQDLPWRQNQYRRSCSLFLLLVPRSVSPDQHELPQPHGWPQHSPAAAAAVGERCWPWPVASPEQVCREMNLWGVPRPPAAGHAAT